MTIQPIGSIVAYPGKAAPKGWLLCDGAEIPKPKEFDALRSLVGPKTPNLQGYFLRGVEGNRALLSAQGDSVGPHTHPFALAFHETAGKSGAGNPDVFANYSTSSTGGPNPSDGETRPKNIGVNFIIKAVDEG